MPVFLYPVPVVCRKYDSLSFREAINVRMKERPKMFKWTLVDPPVKTEMCPKNISFLYLGNVCKHCML